MQVLLFRLSSSFSSDTWRKAMEHPTGASLKFLVEFFKDTCGDGVCICETADFRSATLNEAKTTANEIFRWYFGKILLKLYVFLYILMA